MDRQRGARTRPPEESNDAAPEKRGLDSAPASGDGRSRTSGDSHQPSGALAWDGGGQHSSSDIWQSADDPIAMLTGDLSRMTVAQQPQPQPPPQVPWTSPPMTSLKHQAQGAAMDPPGLGYRVAASPGYPPHSVDPATGARCPIPASILAESLLAAQPLHLPEMSLPPSANANTRLPPCRNFLHNRCYKGDRCIYSHDIEYIRHVSLPERGLCMEFIFGVCNLRLCRFRHNSDMVRHLLLEEVNHLHKPARNKSGICLDYMHGSCTKGLSCPFSHSLRDYYLQVCKRCPQANPGRRLQAEQALAHYVASASMPGSLVGNSEYYQQGVMRLQRLHALRAVIPPLVPNDPLRAEAIIAALDSHPDIAPAIISLYDTFGHAASPGGVGAPSPAPQYLPHPATAPHMPGGVPPSVMLHPSRYGSGEGGPPEAGGLPPYMPGYPPPHHQ